MAGRLGNYEENTKIKGQKDERCNDWVTSLERPDAACEFLFDGCFGTCFTACPPYQMVFLGSRPFFLKQSRPLMRTRFKKVERQLYAARCVGPGKASVNVCPNQRSSRSAEKTIKRLNNGEKKAVKAQVILKVVGYMSS